MTTMDYMWALTFILASYYFLLRRTAPWPGLMLGLGDCFAFDLRSSCSCRCSPTCGATGVATRSVHSSSPLSPSRSLAWAPIYWKYELRFLNFYDSEVGLPGRAAPAREGHASACSGRWRSSSRSWFRCRGLRGCRPTSCATRTSWCGCSRSRVGDHLVHATPARSGVPDSDLSRSGSSSWRSTSARWCLRRRWRHRRSRASSTSRRPARRSASSALADARPGQGLVLSNRDTMLKQIDFAEDVRALRAPAKYGDFHGVRLPNPRREVLRRTERRHPRRGSSRRSASFRTEARRRTISAR